MKTALEAAYLAGFNASGEGYNGEYPFGDICKHPEDHSVWCKDRDNALEEALAEQHLQDLHDENVRLGLYEQEQGEPVAWADHGVVNWIADKQFKHAALLYEHPQQRKPLTDEQMWALWNSRGIDDMGQQDAIDFARAIEAAHGIKEKNT